MISIIFYKSGCESLVTVGAPEVKNSEKKLIFIFWILKFRHFRQKLVKRKQMLTHMSHH